MHDVVVMAVSTAEAAAMTMRSTISQTELPFSFPIAITA